MNKKDKHFVKNQKAGYAAEALRKQSNGEIPSDVLGSYTGTARKGEVPEQDADDL